MNRIKMLSCAAALSGTLSGVAATTFSELQQEIDAAEDGATVYVENDMEYTGQLNFGTKTITLASPDGQTNTLTRAADWADGTLMCCAVDDTSFNTNYLPSVTLQRLVIDGNKAAGKSRSWPFNLAYGWLQLHGGATIRNFYCSTAGGTLRVIRRGYISMYNGATIRDCEHDGYASAVLSGDGAGDATLGYGVFAMAGGAIINCADHYGVRNEGWGGTVYTYGGLANLSGGVISNNVSDHCVGGVNGFSGCVMLSRDAIVVDNFGPVANNILIRGAMSLGADYTGRATLKLGGNASPLTPGAHTQKIYVNALGATYAGFDSVSYEDNPSLVMDAETTVDGWYPVWTNRVAATKSHSYVRLPKDKALHLTEDDTLTLHADCDAPNYIWVRNGATVTVTSAEGGPYRLRRSTSIEPLFVDKESTLILTNVVVDGLNRLVEPDADGWKALVGVQGGRLILEDGAILENAFTTVPTAAMVDLRANGASCEMRDGAIIRNCVISNNDGYATAVRVGTGSVCDEPPTFIMKGGVISNCVSTTTHAGNTGWGGTVYLYNGNMRLEGGTITANSANDAPSGLYAYRGTVWFTGSPNVSGNLGPCPDVCFHGGNPNLGYIEGALRGHLGFSSAEQRVDAQLKVKCLEGASGAWSFFSPRSNPEGKFVGYMWKSNRMVYFGVPDGWVDGAGYVSSYEDPTPLVPTAIDVEAETNALPHVFAGAACALGGVIDLRVADERALRAAGETGIALLAADAGGSLTGEWSFTSVPVSDYGRWRVRKVRSAGGVAAYKLTWSSSGLYLLVR